MNLFLSPFFDIFSLVSPTHGSHFVFHNHDWSIKTTTHWWWPLVVFSSVSITFEVEPKLIADVYCCENALWNWPLKTCAKLLKKIKKLMELKKKLAAAAPCTDWAFFTASIPVKNTDLNWSWLIVFNTIESFAHHRALSCIFHATGHYKQSRRPSEVEVVLRPCLVVGIAKTSFCENDFR